MSAVIKDMYPQFLCVSSVISVTSVTSDTLTFTLLIRFKNTKRNDTHKETIPVSMFLRYK